MGVGSMKGDAIAVGILSIVVLILLAVLQALKDAGLDNDNTSVMNDTVDKFITGLGYFATFIGIVVLVLLAKIIIGIFKKAG